MNDFDYKKYSLDNLEKWIEDAINSSEASPQEIFDVIKNVVADNYYCYKNYTERCYELLSLLNGNGNISLSDVLKEREYYEGVRHELVCDKNDKSPECQKAWNDFWEENYYPEEHEVEDTMPPWGHSDMEALRYTEEELNAMCDKAASDNNKKEWKVVNEYEPYPIHVSEDGDVWIPDSVTKEDKVVKWQLPVQVDGLTGDCIVEFPDDLLEAADLKEGDLVEWVDIGGGSFELRKVNGTK